MKVKSESEIAQSCPTLSDPMDCSPPGSSVHGIFQARILEWVAVAHHKYFGNLTHLVVYFYKEVFESWKSRKYFFATLFINCCCLVAKSCLPLCDPMDCSPPGSSAHGDSPGKNTGVSCHALLQGVFLTQESNRGLPHGGRIVYRLSHQRSPSCSG